MYVCMYVCIQYASRCLYACIHKYIIFHLPFFCANLGGKYPLATLSSAGKVTVSAVLLTNNTFSNQLLFDLTPITSQLRAGGVAQVTHCVIFFYFFYTFSVPTITLTLCLNVFVGSKFDILLLSSVRYGGGLRGQHVDAYEHRQRHSRRSQRHGILR